MISLARVDRGIADGAQVRVRWGGFSDEPVALIRAKVVPLPFIGDVGRRPAARRFLRYPSIFPRRKTRA